MLRRTTWLASRNGRGKASTTTQCRRRYAQKIRVYTKTGDTGTSSLFSGERRHKDDAVFHALGDTDELNAAIGLAAKFCADSNNGLAEFLPEIQSRLLDIGSHIATPPSSASDKHLARATFSEEHTKQLEKWIDSIDEKLPPLRNFILPGGGKAASQLHVCRAMCRRAERSVVSLSEHVSPSVLSFINRLSDFFFVSARHAAQHDNEPEVIYKKAKETTQTTPSSSE